MYSFKEHWDEKADKEITDRSVLLGLLASCHVGRLGTVGSDGYLMVKPLNFAYTDGKIYFHSAKEGEKMEDIRRDNRVCFEVDLPIALVRARRNPCDCEYLYRSVIIKGRAHIVEDAEERLLALECLMNKYQPEGGYGGYNEKRLGLTAVVRIEVEEMTGKEDLGKGNPRQAALNALEENILLPITLEREE